ncbi:hypothetical protein [Wenxinia saemankumensis]|nr:hypothetical protein [Wenxinia saemankumensis]
MRRRPTPAVLVTGPGGTARVTAIGRTVRLVALCGVVPCLARRLGLPAVPLPDLQRPGAPPLGCRPVPAR